MRISDWSSDVCSSDLDRADGVNHRRMVAPAKAASDFGLGTRRKFLRQIHRDLARAGDRADAALRRHLGLVEPDVRAHRALDLVDRDARPRAAHIYIGIA